MQPHTDSEYKKIFTELIRRQMAILGPDITLSKAKNVQGLTLNEKGEVTNIDGDPQVILQLLINQFVELSGMIVKKTMESILTTYPGVAGLATGAVAANISTVTTQVSPINQTQNDPVETPKVMGANAFSDVSFSQNTPSEKENTTREIAKDEMDSINKALSELSISPVAAPYDSGIENKSNSVSQ